MLVSARIAAEIATRLGAPSVIGELAAGIVLGPSVLGWLTPSEIIQVLAEIGIILLLFDVGLETDIGRLVSAGSRSITMALGGFVIPFVMGYAASRYLFGQEVLVASFVGGTLTATSIGVTVRILRDVNRQNSREGQIVLGAAVIDDILGILLLALLYDFSDSGNLSAGNLGRLALFIGVFFVTAPLAAKLISYLIGHYHRVTQIPGLVATTIVSLVMVFAWLAHFVGAPELLGGFAAGLALSRRFFLPFGIALAQNHRFADEVERDMKPIVQLFTPIFFVTVGLSLDLREIDWSSAFIWLFSLSVGFIAVAGKIAGGHLLLREHWLMRTAVGVAMVPRGEVGLVFAGVGRAAGIFDGATYAAVVLVIAYTTLFAPFWIKLFYKLFGRHPALSGSDDTGSRAART